MAHVDLNRVESRIKATFGSVHEQINHARHIFFVHRAAEHVSTQ